MQPQNLPNLLRQNPYPGRGITLGVDSSANAYIAYFIMGRSENSRNRIFAKTADGIETKAADPAKLADPSLIIYTPVRKAGDVTIVTNGDQTDTVYNSLVAGESFEAALRTRTFEPDAPNLTPRISGQLVRSDGGFCYTLSILKSAGGNEASAQRFFYEYPQPLAGVGHFISTYQADGNPLPSFSGEPIAVKIGGDIDSFGEEIWQSLNEQNKVSLFVRCISPQGQEQTRIYNKYNKE